VREEIERLIKEHAATGDRPLSADLVLAGEGLALDSVGLVELLLACEDRFRVAFTAELLEDSPITLGKLVQYVRRACAEKVTPPS
jgi:acyl carrier protein